MPGGWARAITPGQRARTVTAAASQAWRIELHFARGCRRVHRQSERRGAPAIADACRARVATRPRLLDRKFRCSACSFGGADLISAVESRAASELKSARRGAPSL